VTINVNLWVQKAAIAVEIATVLNSRRSYGTEKQEMWSAKRTKLSLTETESAEWNGMESAEQNGIRGMERNIFRGMIPRNSSLLGDRCLEKAASLGTTSSVRIMEQQKQQDALAAVETLLNQLSLNHSSPGCGCIIDRINRSTNVMYIC